MAETGGVMAVLIGISLGQVQSGSTGATRNRVRLEAAADGTHAILADSRGVIGNIRLDDAVLVLWHSDSAGTFHGFACVEQAKTVKADQVARLSVGLDDSARIKGVLAESGSGAGDIAGAIVRIPPEGVLLVTSGYKRRNFRYRLVRQDGTVETLTPQDYRARFATAGDAVSI